MTTRSQEIQKRSQPRKPRPLFVLFCSELPEKKETNLKYFLIVD